MCLGKQAIAIAGIINANIKTICPIHQAPIHLGSVCSIGGGLLGLMKYLRQTEAKDNPRDGPRNLPNDEMLIKSGAKALGALSSTNVDPRIQCIVSPHPYTKCAIKNIICGVYSDSTSEMQFEMPKRDCH